MAETPKNRDELIMNVWIAASIAHSTRAEITKIIEAIESIGLRIVPAELPHGYFDATKEAMASAYRDVGDIWENVYAAAIAASPFARENPNG